MAPTQVHLRPPYFADNMWYSAVPPQLQQDIGEYLQVGSAPELSRVIGLVAPHAGHLFSGHVAGAAFASLTPGLFETVVLIGPDHHGAAPGRVSTVQAELWRTPLGDIPVAWDVLQALQAEIPLKVLAADREHSLEIELPFLQQTLRQFRLVPLMMGDQSVETCQALGQALVKAMAPAGPALLVASSDLSHYFDDTTARRLDKITLQFVLDLDAAGLIGHVETGRRHGEPLACGAGPIATVIYAATAMGATQARLLKYATSADVHPRKDRVVGYAAVAMGLLS